MPEQLTTEQGPLATFREAFDRVVDDFLRGNWEAGYEPTRGQIYLLLQAAQKALEQGVARDEIRGVIMIPNIATGKEGMDPRLVNPDERHKAVTVFRSHLATKLVTALGE